MDIVYVGDVIGLNNLGVFIIGDMVYIGEKIIYFFILFFFFELFVYFRFIDFS